MRSFLVDAAATAEIHKIFRESGLADPVARLSERSERTSLFEDLTTDLLEGKRTAKEVSELGKRRLDNVEGQLKSYLDIAAEVRSRLSPGDLTTVGNVTFAMSSYAAAKLGGYCLTFESDRFFLKGPDGSLHTLRSIWNLSS